MQAIISSKIVAQNKAHLQELLFIKRIKPSLIDTSCVTDMSYLFAQDISLKEAIIRHLEPITEKRQSYLPQVYASSAFKELQIAIELVCELYTKPLLKLRSHNKTNLTCLKQHNLSQFASSYTLYQQNLLIEKLADACDIDEKSLYEILYVLQNLSCAPNSPCLSSKPQQELTITEDLAQIGNQTQEQTVTHKVNLKLQTSKTDTFFDATQNATFAINFAEIASWDVSNVKDMRYMFFGCTNLNIDFTKWQPRSLVHADFMFAHCKTFAGKGLATWQVPKLQTMQAMFANCQKLKADLSKWQAQIKEFKACFAGCYQFNSELSLDLTQVIDLSYAFAYAKRFNGLIHCFAIQNKDQYVDLSHLTTKIPATCQNLHACFFACKKFNQNLAYLNTAKVKDFSACFMQAPSFNQDLSTWKFTKEAQDLSFMFCECDDFNQSLARQECDTSQVTDMTAMFAYCTQLKDASFLERFNVVNCRSLAAMFKACIYLKADLSAWNTSNCLDFTEMFSRCSSFDCNLSNWNVKQAQSFFAMFWGCTSFTGQGASLNKWQVQEALNLHAMFCYCEKFPTVQLKTVIKQLVFLSQKHRFYGNESSLLSYYFCKELILMLKHKHYQIPSSYHDAFVLWKQIHYSSVQLHY